MASLSLLCLCGCAVLLLAAQASAQSIKCYECAFQGCQDEFNPNANGVTEVNCTGSCTKSTTGDMVARACIPSIKQDQCEEEDGNHACVCSTNLCNGSKTVTYSIAAMASLALVATLITRV